MNKTLKKVLIVLAVVAAVFAVGGVIVNRVAESKLRSALSGIPGVKIDFGRLHLSLLAGNLELKDVILEIADALYNDCKMTEFGKYRDPVWIKKYIEMTWPK